MTLLILSISAGAGHVQAARALEEAAREGSPEDVVHWDVLEFTSKLYRKAYSESYKILVTHNPALWGYLYASSDRKRARREQHGIVRLFDRIQFLRFRDALRKLAPSRVLATHFLPAVVLAPYRRRWADFPFGLVLTDFDAHEFWVQPSADRFFVGSEELRAVLSGKGIEESRIQPTGIPVRPAFGRRMSRARLRSEMGLDPERPVVLVMSGGFGMAVVEDTVVAALENPGVQVLAVAGRNGRLEKRLREIASDRLHVHGFVEDIAPLMASADLVVGKSGGLTSSECLALGRPMLVRDPIPGQEERNCDFLLESGAALKALGPEALRFKLRSLMGEPRRLAAMGRAARRAGRPDAARRIVEEMSVLRSGQV